MAFAIRAHRHLWGKNNQDPLAFLFCQGLTHAFSRSMYLGWNKHGQHRAYDGWGIDREGRFFLPPGIVVPHIVDQTLYALFILSMTDPDHVARVPGSRPGPLVMGDPCGPCQEVRGLIKGLTLLQDHPSPLCVRIIVPET